VCRGNGILVQALEVCVSCFYSFNRFLMPNPFESSAAPPAVDVPASSYPPASPGEAGIPFDEETAEQWAERWRAAKRSSPPLPGYVLTTEREHALWLELQDELIKLAFEPHLTEQQPAFIAAPSREYLETVERA
jgi:hypothetical protein